MAYPTHYGAVSPPTYPVPMGAGYSPQQAAGVSMHAEVPPAAAPPARPGTLPVGTRIMIGQYKVTIERFLSEGGFAHVYVARSSAPITTGGSSQTQHVLKRLAVPDKQQLQEVRKEVENMKRVSGHPHIVNFIEASASQLPGGSGYEVFILMEYVPGGGIIDMMNTRLQNRLTESEILKIFSDTVEAVAHMHHLNPPMMHRDLKVENILMASPSNYKLCDFGSATIPLPKAPQTMPEIQALEQDLNRTTTLQYRAPEMLDVWARKHVGLPADVWALGVFLYKLCYYTTPFEPHGVMAIQNVNYSFPNYPAYSESIKKLIASMLRGDASKRPDIAAVHQQVCRLRGIAPKITSPATTGPPLDGPAPALPRRPKGNLMSPPASSTSAPPGVLSPVRSPEPVNEGPSLADAIAPMRRGRPTSHRAAPSVTAASTPSGLKAGFDDAFKPASQASSSAPPMRVPSPPMPATKSPVPPPSSEPHRHKSTEITDFESQFPALDDEFSISGASAASPTLTSQSSPVVEQPTAPQIQRHASGFKDLLAPTPQTASPSVSRSSSRSSSQLKHDTGSAKSPTSSTSLRVNTSGPPVKPPKPQLVSTASQTGPELMESWFIERSKALSAAREYEERPRQHSGQRQASSSSNVRRPQKLVSTGEDPTPRPSSSSAGPPEQIQRFDLLADSPPPISSPAPRHSSSTAVQDVQDALPALRANFMRNGSMSMYSDSVPSIATSQTDSTQSEAYSDAIRRFQPIPESITSGSSAGGRSDSINTDRAHRVPTVSTDSSDSDAEEDGPEDLDAVRRRPGRSSSGPSTPLAEAPPAAFSPPSVKSPPIVQPKPTSAALSPAPSSSQPIPRVSRSPPEIVAPIPQQPRAAISNLVSRYETMSGPDSLPESAAPSKPLRQRPQSLYGTSSSRGPSTGSPAPFKPSKPSPGPKPSAGPKPAVAESPSEEPEEPFVGVAKMKERWQSRAV